MTSPKLVPMSEYQDAVDSYLGYCTVCRDFTRDSTEPDAEGYDCPDCGNDSVVGAENAMIMGLIEVVPDERD